VTSANDVVYVRIGRGTISVPRERVVRIEVAPAAEPGAADGKGGPEAADPPLAADPDAVETLRQAIGKKARIHRTAHWIVAYDSPRGVARRRARMLEDAWSKFFQMTGHMGLEPTPVERPLEVLHFARFSDWQLAIGLPDEAVRTLNGIYLHRTGRIYVYETATGPGAIKARTEAAKRTTAVELARAALTEQEEALDRIQNEWQELGDDSRAGRKRREDAARRIEEMREEIEQRGHDLDRAEREVADFTRELDRYSLREDLSSTTHEACHQIAFATGICRPGQSSWLIEGLATLFEISSPQSFLLDGVNRARLDDLEQAREKGLELRLRPIVSDSIFAPEGPGGAVAYARAWALAHFLYKTRTEQFARYVRDAKGFPAGAEHGDSRVQEFESAFGTDIPTLEREWLEFIDRL